nr:MAG TPA: hypothetical protein [Caudoviricetes sp.]
MEWTAGKLSEHLVQIFFHESCIYMDVLNELLQNSYFVWQY